MKPFKYRPGPEELDWEDNWLSNLMAWFSTIFMPNWCKDDKHWTVWIVLKLWSDCSCCLCFRFFFLGMLSSSVLFGLILILMK